MIYETIRNRYDAHSKTLIDVHNFMQFTQNATDPSYIVTEENYHVADDLIRTLHKIHDKFVSSNHSGTTNMAMMPLVWAKDLDLLIHEEALF